MEIGEPRFTQSRLNVTGPVQQELCNKGDESRVATPKTNKTKPKCESPQIEANKPSQAKLCKSIKLPVVEKSKVNNRKPLRKEECTNGDSPKVAVSSAKVANSK